MKVVHGVEDLTPEDGRLFVVIGVFDGLHRGHLYLLEQLGQAARDHDAEPAVITFDHHPEEVITGQAPPLLCDPGERLERLEAAGVAVTVVQTFDVALRMTPFDDFVRRIADRVDLAGFLMTPESAFGHDRGGTTETVAALGKVVGYDVVVVPQFELEGRPVRSTDIRTAIAAGDLREAERLLGRPVSVVGIVARAARDLTELSFPMPVSLPPPGAYEAALTSPGGGVRLRDVEVVAGGVTVAGSMPARVGDRLSISLRRARSGIGW